MNLRSVALLGMTSEPRVPMPRMPMLPPIAAAVPPLPP